MRQFEALIANERQDTEQERALKYRREQWRHEARLQFADTLLQHQLDRGDVDANTLLETADQLALAMYPEP